MKKDIESREDLVLLMSHFYKLMLEDIVLGPIFKDVAKINLETHIPYLVDFWHSVLFMTGAYKRNVMEMHLALNRQTELSKRHFDRWLSYFEQSVCHLFEGPVSTMAIERANSIAILMQVKIGQTKS